MEEENKPITKAECMNEISINLNGMVSWPSSGGIVWDGHWATPDETELVANCLLDAAKRAREMNEATNG